MQTQRAFFVAPDNGVLSLVLQLASEAEFYEIIPSNYLLPSISRTFHGRDIFAPAAAHLASGILPDQIGRRIDEIVTFSPQRPQKQDDHLIGEIIYIDHFGNCISNISADLLPESPKRIITVNQLTLNLSYTYADVSIGSTLALIGSSGYLEIAVRDGNACDQLGLTLGAKVAVNWA